ncbi:pericentriolar material 1 protein isoform X2 [Hetaerina americana]|uniref:pericentriolar material 1 protein isoform X2 n=1 Tax=Hetaerina americana TaxID=62018 RepID=UPI003A7F16DC
MAPGVNGSGKHTGTVPKSKTHNDGRRESDNRRDSGINNMSNNLAPFDWQQIPDSSQNSSLKPSNTRTCDSDCYEIDGTVSHDIDNRRRRVLDEQGVQPPYLPFGYPPASVKPTPNPRQLRHNTHRLTCFSQPSLHSSHINQSHGTYHMMMASDEEEGASSFDSIRFQQLHSLNERNGGAPDWVDQGGSGEGRASREHISPSGSEPHSRGASKPRDERDRNILPERENKSNITKMPDRNQVLSRLNQIRDYINQTTSLMDRMQHSRDPRVVAEYCKLTKMLLGLRDSEKKLEDLLSTLKNLAECGEIDISGGCVGKMKQSNPDVRRVAGQPGRNISRENEMNSQVANAPHHPSDMASAVAKSSEAGHRNELRAKLQKTELEQTQNEDVTSSQDFSRSPVAEVPPSIRKGKLDHLKDRIQALKELYENRNQLMELLGDEDEELSSEHHALQNKLEDLQQKKSQMDQLVQELRSLNSFMPDEDAAEASNEAVSNEAVQEVSNADNENEQQPEHDIQEVLKNMEELKHMKERLAILQGMMNVTANQIQASGGGSDGAIGGDKEDNSVNIRRERENSREQPNSSKPDNISLSSEAGSISNSDSRQLYLSTQELERKTLKLQEAKLRLQQLEKLLDVMQDNRKDGPSLTSEHYSQLMQSLGDEDEAAGGDSTLDDTKVQELLGNVADDQSLHSNSRKSSRKKYGSMSADEAGSFHGSQQMQQPTRSRSSSMRDCEATEIRQNRPSSPLSTELSMEALQAMTQNLREQAMTIRSERDRLAAVKWQISQRRRTEPLPPSPPPSSSASTSSASSFVRRVKNRNAVSLDTQSCRQMFLQAELQAKRRELEELMKKDRGHQTSINQDVCSEISAGKSEVPGFSHVTVEGTTTNATWGGSTQGTLDDLAERDIEIQDQSGGYSSDEGRNDDETKEGTNFHQSSAFQDQRMTQLNVSMAREQQNIRSQSAQSLQGVSRSSHGRSPVRMSQGHMQQPQANSTPSRNQMPATSHNVWKKDSHEGAPRAVWTPSVHARQENLCSADELVADSSANSHAAGPPSSFPSAPPSVHHLPQGNPPNTLPPGSSWWQQQAQHLQNQLEATSSLCQSLMTEQQHQAGGQGCTLPGMPGGYNLAHPHPIGFATPPAPSSWPFPNMASPWMLTPTSLLPSSDHSPSSITLHSCASHQLQQQQVLLTLSQCCHLLWLQHRELASLQATVQGIQERVGREPRVAQDEEELRSMQMQQHPQLQQPQVLPQSFPYPNRVTTPNTQATFSVPMSIAQPTPLRVSSGIVTTAALKGRLLKPTHPPATYPEASREGLVSGDTSAAHGVAGAGGASGVSSAHSLPNLCASGAPMMGLPHLLPQSAETHLTSPGASYPFPPEHLHPPPPPPPLGTTSYGHADHWALHPGAATRGPPVALNNQVPPGIRANNYWDNFRR